jgi:hypothetical protein
MRSHLVFVAQEQLPNRFELVMAATLFARKTHKPNTRMARTINQALEQIATTKGGEN